MLQELDDHVKGAEDGTIASNAEAALALALSVDNWKDLILWGPDIERAIERFRSTQ